MAGENQQLKAEARIADIENVGSEEERKALEGQAKSMVMKIEELEEKVGIDPLTGARRREVLVAELDHMLKRIHDSSGEHRKEGVSLILLDLDNFKQVNDRLGHNAGDRVLARVAELMQGPLREADILARYGGDEFAVLLPNTNEEHAVIVAEKLRAVFEDAELKELGITASFGVCSSEHSSAADSKTFINNADKAAYLAKHSGRNAVKVYHGS